MRVADLRQRVLEKVAEASGSGDEDTTARVLDFAQGLLVALAPHSTDEEIDLDRLTIRTGTAARILGRHQEYVRELIRKGELRATKENGEYNIPLSQAMNFKARAEKIIKPSGEAWGPDTAWFGLWHPHPCPPPPPPRSNHGRVSSQADQHLSQYPSPCATRSWHIDGCGEGRYDVRRTSGGLERAECRSYMVSESRSS